MRKFTYVSERKIEVVALCGYCYSREYDKGSKCVSERTGLTADHRARRALFVCIYNSHARSSDMEAVYSRNEEHLSIRPRERIQTIKVRIGHPDQLWSSNKTLLETFHSCFQTQSEC